MLPRRGAKYTSKKGYKHQSGFVELNKIFSKLRNILVLLIN